VSRAQPSSRRRRWTLPASTWRSPGSTRPRRPVAPDRARARRTAGTGSPDRRSARWTSRADPVAHAVGPARSRAPARRPSRAVRRRGRRRQSAAGRLVPASSRATAPREPREQRGAAAGIGLVAPFERDDRAASDRTRPDDRPVLVADTDVRSGADQ
jgi:hypothetical protein